jgi:hypothetical protein
MSEESILTEDGRKFALKKSFGIEGQFSFQLPAGSKKLKEELIPGKFCFTRVTEGYAHSSNYLLSSIDRSWYNAHRLPDRCEHRQHLSFIETKDLDICMPCRELNIIGRR